MLLHRAGPLRKVIVSCDMEFATLCGFCVQKFINTKKTSPLYGEVCRTVCIKEETAVLLPRHVPDAVESFAHCREVDDNKGDHCLCQQKTEIIDDRIEGSQ